MSAHPREAEIRALLHTAEYPPRVAVEDVDQAVVAVVRLAASLPWKGPVTSFLSVRAIVGTALGSLAPDMDALREELRVARREVSSLRLLVADVARVSPSVLRAVESARETGIWPDGSEEGP